MKRLTDDKLRELDDQLDYASLHERITTNVTCKELAALIAELRALRALLATPLPCGFDTPRFVRQVGHGGIDGVEWNPFGTRGGGIAYEPDEAVAIGAALIRAALEAQSALAGKGDSK